MFKNSKFMSYIRGNIKRVALVSIAILFTVLLVVLMLLKTPTKQDNHVLNNPIESAEKEEQGSDITTDDTNEKVIESETKENIDNISSDTESKKTDSSKTLKNSPKKSDVKKKNKPVAKHEHIWKEVYIDHPFQYQDGYWRFPDGTIETGYYAFGDTDNVMYAEDMPFRGFIDVYAAHAETNWWSKKSNVVITGYEKVKYIYFQDGEENEKFPVDFLPSGYMEWHARRYGPDKYTYGFETLPIRKEVEKYFVETVAEKEAWREVTHEVCYCGETRGV